MKSRIALMSILLASFGGIAQADTITIGKEQSGHQPIVIRGAPFRCDEKRPQVINVQESLKKTYNDASECVAKFRPAHRDRVYSITNIIVIAGRHERVYIKHH